MLSVFTVAATPWARYFFRGKRAKSGTAFVCRLLVGQSSRGTRRAGKLLHQAGVLPCPDAVADAGGAQLQGLPDALRAGGLPGVEGKRHPQGLGVGKERLVTPGWE